ncbi:MAG: hypothetical protein V4495_30660 [Pseudomonadota bacterium]
MTTLRSYIVGMQKTCGDTEIIFVAKGIRAGCVLSVALAVEFNFAISVKPGFIDCQRAGGRHRGDSVTVQMNEFHGMQTPDVKGMSVRSYATDTPSVLDLRDFACARW